jgi:protein phosphatase
MRVLLISDIHSNIEAFRAVLDQTSFDEVLFMGDIVDYGPNPSEVFDLLQELAPKRVLGNHDVAAAFRVDCRSSPSMHEASQVTRERITWKLLPKESLEILGKAEYIQNIDYDGLRIRMLHAAPGSLLYKYITREEAERLTLRDTDLLLLGHIHIAYEVKNEGAWVVNPGSVGMPGDGDSRASYAILDTDASEVAFRRAKYDIENVISKLKVLLYGEDEVLNTLVKALYHAQR